MSNFSAIRAIIIVVIIIMGALGMLSLKNALSLPTEQRQRQVTRAAFLLLSAVLLIILLAFLSGNDSIFR